MRVLTVKFIWPILLALKGSIADNVDDSIILDLCFNGTLEEIYSNCIFQHVVACAGNQTIDAVSLVVQQCKHSLKNITFEGLGFSCDEPGWIEFLKDAQKQNISINSADTACKRPILQCYLKNQRDFIKQMECQIEKRKEKSAWCTVQVGMGVNFVGVDCRRLSFTNEDLALIFPNDTVTINFSDNQLTDVSPLMKTILDLPRLGYLHFNNNSIKDLPALPNVQKGKKSISFNFRRNKISTLNIETIKSYLFHKGVKLHLKYNNLKCDCNMAEVLDELRLELPALISDLFYISCTNQSGLQTRPWYADYSECKKFALFSLDTYDWLIIVMSAMVGMAAYLWVDLSKAIRQLDSGIEEPHTPRIHLVIEWIRGRQHAIREKFSEKKFSTIDSVKNEGSQS